jgi:hypothetical protein
VPHPDDLERSEIEALGATRAELGRDYEPALLESFADKVEAAIEQRVDRALAQSQRGSGMERRLAGQQLALGIISLVAAIPISIVLGLSDDGLPALLIAWLGIVAVNWAHAFQGRRSR